MSKIKVLPDSLANRIAAGEVVERPASVVKELLENALDAGANTIRLEGEAGGKSMRRGIGDGHGMTPDDALLAFERHHVRLHRLSPRRVRASLARPAHVPRTPARSTI